MAAYEWLLAETKGALDRKDIKRIREQTYFGQDLVPRPRRLATDETFSCTVCTENSSRGHNLRTGSRRAL
jgi:hypothetical protein